MTCQLDGGWMWKSWRKTLSSWLKAFSWEMDSDGGDGWGRGVSADDIDDGWANQNTTADIQTPFVYSRMGEEILNSLHTLSSVILNSLPWTSYLFPCFLSLGLHFCLTVLLYISLHSSCCVCLCLSICHTILNPFVFSLWLSLSLWPFTSLLALYVCLTSVPFVSLFGPCSFPFSTLGSRDFYVNNENTPLQLKPLQA